MADEFDPYRSWLGIRDAKRPPNHYRLLGLEAFEDDAEVISNAADRQMSHVRTFQAGKFSEVSQRLLNELSGARLTLLDVKRKKPYDEKLREELAGSRIHAAPPTPPPPPPVPPPPRSGLQAVASPPRSGLQANAPLPAMPPVDAAATSPSTGPISALILDPPAPPANGRGPIVAAAVLGVAALAAVLFFTIGGGGGGGASSTSTAAGTLASAASTGNGSASTATNEPVAATAPPAATTAPAPTAPPATTAAPTVAPTPATTPPAATTAAPTSAGTGVPGRGGVVQDDDGTLHWQAHEGAVTALVSTPNGKVILSAGIGGGTIEVWRSRDGVRLARLAGHRGRVAGIVVLPDGGQVVSVGADGTLRRWSLETNEEVDRGDLESPATALALSHGGGLLAVGLQNGTIRLYETARGGTHVELEEHRGAVRSLAFSSHDQSLFSGGEDGKLVAWNVEKKSTFGAFNFTGGDGKPATIASLTTLEDPLTVLAAGPEIDTSWCEFGGPTAPAELPDGAPRAHAATAAPSLKVAVTAGHDGSIQLWKKKAKAPLEGFAWNVPKPALVVVSPPGHRVVVGDRSGMLHERFVPEELRPELESEGASENESPESSRRTVMLSRSPLHAKGVKRIAVSANGQKCATVSYAGDGRLASTAALDSALTLPAEWGQLNDVAFSVDGKTLYVAAENGKVHRVDVPSGEARGTLEAGPAVLQVAASGEDLLTLDADRRVKLWKGFAAPPLKDVQLPGYGAWIAPLPSGKEAVVVGMDRTVRMLNLEDGALTTWHRLADLPIASAVQTRLEPPTLLAGHAGGSATRIQLQGGSLNETWQSASQSPIYAAAAGGRRFATAGSDQTVRIWDAESLSLLETIGGQEETISAVGVSGEGTTIVSGDRTGNVIAWTLPVEMQPLPSSPRPTTSRRAVVPDKADLAAKKRLLQEANRADFGKKTPAAMLQLADRLVRESDRESDLVMKYAMLDEARGLCCDAFDGKAAFDVVAKTAAVFDVNLAQAHCDVMTELCKPNLPAGSVRWAAEQVIGVLEESLQNDLADDAAKLAKLAEGLGKKLGSVSYSNAMIGYGKRARIQKTEGDKLKKSRDRLAEEPADPDANLAVAKFAAVVKADWDDAIAHLLLAPDARLRAVAARDLLAPQAFDEQVELMRSWAAQADLAAKDERLAYLERAVVWLVACRNRAASDTPIGLEIARNLQKWIDELAPRASAYLETLPEFDSVALNAIGRKGALGFRAANGATNAFINNKVMPHSYCLLPSPTGLAHVNFGLGGHFRTFRAKTAMADTSRPDGSVTFAVYGDDKLLWRSPQVLVGPGIVMDCVIDVSGVRTLRLEISGDPSDGKAHAVWIDPQVWRIPLVEGNAAVRRIRRRDANLPINAPNMPINPPNLPLNPNRNLPPPKK